MYFYHQARRMDEWSGRPHGACSTCQEGTLTVPEVDMYIYMGVVRGNGSRAYLPVGQVD